MLLTRSKQGRLQGGYQPFFRLPPGTLVTAKKQFTGTPCDGSKQSHRIEEGIDGIVEEGLDQSVEEGKPAKLFVSFSAGVGRTVCVSVEQDLLNVIG